MFRTFVMSLLATVGVALSAHADTVPVDLTKFLVPRHTLSTQDSDPFMLAGRVMDERQPRWDEFEDTLAAFPDTSSCLLPDERDKDVQNLLAFDWKAMRYLTEIDICVWRIATTLDDIDLMRDWLALQGFSGSYNTQSCDNTVRTPYAKDSDEFCGVYGVMSVEDFDSKTSSYDNMSFLTRWFWRGISRRATLGIGYDHNLRVRDISSAVISE
jgi:hypothetical protein